jgi:hypothetical protein
MNACTPCTLSSLKYRGITGIASLDMGCQSFDDTIANVQAPAFGATIECQPSIRSAAYHCCLSLFSGKTPVAMISEKTTVVSDIYYTFDALFALRNGE